MIIPMVCFTCGKPIAHLWRPYLEWVQNYTQMYQEKIEQIKQRALIDPNKIIPDENKIAEQINEFRHATPTP